MYSPPFYLLSRSHALSHLSPGNQTAGTKAHVSDLHVLVTLQRDRAPAITLGENKSV